MKCAAVVDNLDELHNGELGDADLEIGIHCAPINSSKASADPAHITITAAREDTWISWYCAPGPKL